MTIGIGLKCRDGIVLGADTEVTWPGYFKYPESKITVVAGLGERVFFAQAGDLQFSHMAIRRLSRRIKEANPRTLLATEDVVQEECRKIYAEFSPYEPQRYFLSLLMVIRLSAHAHLRRIDGPVLSAISSGFGYIGMGEMVSRGITESSFHSQMTVKEAAFVAAYVIREAKKHGYAVGGQSQILAIPDQGEWDYLQQSEIEHLERSLDEAQEFLGRLLTRYTAMFQKSPEFDSDLKKLAKILRKAHRERGHLAGEKRQAEFDRDVSSQEQDASGDE